MAWKFVKESKYIQQEDWSKNIPAKWHQKVSSKPYKNEAPTVCASSFGGMKMQIICNGCYSCCLAHCCELFSCDYNKYSVQIYTEQN